jgi:anion-transporting  ArsA/GET3 family ATPase
MSRGPTQSTGSASPLAPFLRGARLIVCCGSGGVGKTTSSAALALRAAEEGRRALVLTVDPARRLASCLGLDEVGWRPHRVATDGAEGELWAMMLDTRAMFDDLVRRLAPDAEAAERIQRSRLYAIFAGTMHGTPEYMALESLYSAYQDERFDLIVLDTPPLTNALEFFTAPERASWMFDDRIIRWFVDDGRPRSWLGSLRPGSVVLKLLASLAGDGLVQSLVEFFTALGVIREALRERGVAVGKLLRDPETSYVVVTGPHVRRIDEALVLDRQLRTLHQHADAFVVNRCHTEYAPDAQPLSSDEALRCALESLGVTHPLAAVESVRDAHSQMAASGLRHREQLERLAQEVGPTRIRVVPDLEEDVHDLRALARLGRLMVD